MSLKHSVWTSVKASGLPRIRPPVQQTKETIWRLSDRNLVSDWLRTWKPPFCLWIYFYSTFLFTCWPTLHALLSHTDCVAPYDACGTHQMLAGQKRKVYAENNQWGCFNGQQQRHRHVLSLQSGHTHFKWHIQGICRCSINYSPGSQGSFLDSTNIGIICIVYIYIYFQFTQWMPFNTASHRSYHQQECRAHLTSSYPILMDVVCKIIMKKILILTMSYYKQQQQNFPILNIPKQKWHHGPSALDWWWLETTEHLEGVWMHFSHLLAIFLISCLHCAAVSLHCEETVQGNVPGNCFGLCRTNWEQCTSRWSLVNSL